MNLDSDSSCVLFNISMSVSTCFFIHIYLAHGCSDDEIIYVKYTQCLEGAEQYIIALSF